MSKFVETWMYEDTRTAFGILCVKTEAGGFLVISCFGDQMRYAEVLLLGQTHVWWSTNDARWTRLG